MLYAPLAKCVLHVALPLVTLTALQPAIGAPFALNPIVPPEGDPVTFAISVAAPVGGTGLSVLVSFVFVGDPVGAFTSCDTATLDDAVLLASPA